MGRHRPPRGRFPWIVDTTDRQQAMDRPGGWADERTTKASMTCHGLQRRQDRAGNREGPPGGDVHLPAAALSPRLYPHFPLSVLVHSWHMLPSRRTTLVRKLPIPPPKTVNRVCVSKYLCTLQRQQPRHNEALSWPKPRRRRPMLVGRHLTFHAPSRSCVCLARCGRPPRHGG